MKIGERSDTPILFPQPDFESHGVEDPRIVKIEDIYYMSYTAYDGVNALGALAVSKDLMQWEKLGIIVPLMTFDEFNHLAGSKGMLNKKYLRYNKHEGVIENNGKKIFVWDKNFIFFPRQIKGKLYFLHRVKPDIQIVLIKKAAAIKKAEELKKKNDLKKAANDKKKAGVSNPQIIAKDSTRQ